MDKIIFPFVGSSIIMAIIITVHVFFAFMAIGALTYATICEWVGIKNKDKDFVKFSKDITSFMSDYMKINGVLGAIIYTIELNLTE